MNICICKYIILVVIATVEVEMEGKSKLSVRNTSKMLSPGRMRRKGRGE